MASSAHHAGSIREEATMAAITMQLINPSPVRRAPARSTTAIEPEAERAETLPAGKSPMVTAEFQPLEPGIVSEEIPAFFIGRNKEGFWIARDARGRIGGIFLLQNSAVSFAKRNSHSAGCATIFPSERLELDLENQGNPFVAQLRWFKRLAMWESHRAAIKRVCIGALTVLAATAALTAIIGLKAAIYYWRFHN
jgi:hypothetical protein